MRFIARAGTTVLTVAVLGVASAGAAAAHECFRVDPPGNSQMGNGQAWNTAAEAQAFWESVTVDTTACAPLEAALFAVFTAHPDAMFMGPGLLAGGAHHQNKAPDQFDYYGDRIGALFSANCLQF